MHTPIYVEEYIHVTYNLRTHPIPSYKLTFIEFVVFIFHIPHSHWVSDSVQVLIAKVLDLCTKCSADASIYARPILHYK